MLPVALHRNPVNVLRARREVRELNQQQHFHHIHSFGLNSLFMVPPSLFHKTSASIIGSDAFGEVNRAGKYTKLGGIARWWFSSSLSKLAGIRPVSDVVWQKIKDLIPSTMPVAIFPNGINTSLFPEVSKQEARLALQLDAEVVYVFFPSNTKLGVKNFPLAQRIFTEAQKQFGPRLQWLFAPMGGQHLMNLHYRAADITLLTSLHEGSPNVVKESLFCGTPVFASDVGDVKKHVEATGFGAVFNPLANENVVAAQLLQVLAAERNATITAACKSYCINELSAKTAAQRMISFWKAATDL